jgi:hypothetical protein
MGVEDERAFPLDSSQMGEYLPAPETVVVAQLVEPLIVIQVVAGSSPVDHPTFSTFP